MPHSRRECHAQLEIWSPLETSANTKYIMQKWTYHSEPVINFSVASDNNPTQKNYAGYLELKKWVSQTVSHIYLTSKLTKQKDDYWFDITVICSEDGEQSASKMHAYNDKQMNPAF